MVVQSSQPPVPELFQLLQLSVSPVATNSWEFPGGPVVRTQLSLTWPGFSPWLGNKDPASQVAQQKQTNNYPVSGKRHPTSCLYGFVYSRYRTWVVSLQYLSFCNWCISLSITSSSFIPVVAGVGIPPFLRLNDIPLFGLDYIVLTHWSVDWPFF